MIKSPIEHFEPIRSLDASDKYIVTAGYDNKLILWDKETHQMISVMHHDHLVNHCSFSACGKLMISSSSDYSARLWSIPEGKLLKVFLDHTDDVIMSKFSPDSQKIATSSFDGHIYIYDLSYNKIGSIDTQSGIIECITWSLNSSYIYSSGMDNSVKKWDIQGKLINQFSSESNFDIDCVLYSEYLNSIIIGSDDGAIRILSENSMSIIKCLKIHKSGIKNLCIHQNKH